MAHCQDWPKKKKKLSSRMTQLGQRIYDSYFYYCFSSSFFGFVNVKQGIGTALSYETKLAAL